MNSASASGARSPNGRRSFARRRSGSNETMRKLALAALLAVASGVGSAQAQTYPARTVTLVVPIAAGGAVDTAARMFAEKLQEKLGQSFVVENRTGAGAMIGTGYVAKAPPDGYTLLLMESSVVLSKWFHKSV